MIVYISGPMRGYPDNNRAAFASAEAWLNGRFYSVVNPHKLPSLDKDARWHNYMRQDLKAMLDCDAVVALNDWSKSTGACIEIDLAEALGMPIYRIHEGELELLMHYAERAEIR